MSGIHASGKLLGSFKLTPEFSRKGSKCDIDGPSDDDASAKPHSIYVRLLETVPNDWLSLKRTHYSFQTKLATLKPLLREH